MYTYKLEVGANTFYDDKIRSIKVKKAVCGYGSLTIGTVYAKTLEVMLIPGIVTIPKMAEVNLYSAPEGTTTWTPRGSFYVDTRRKGEFTLTLTCIDKVLKMEDPFIQDNVPDTWPQTMLDAATLVCQRIGITIDAGTTISNTWTVPYTNDMTMREVMGFIASAHAGNFIISDSDTLILAPLQASYTSVGTPEVKTFKILAEEIVYDKVTVYYDDKSFYTYGTGDNEFTFRNDFATQDIATSVANKLLGYHHRPFELVRGIFALNTIPEVGQAFTYESLQYIFFEGSINYGYMVTFDMTAPYNQELGHEYPTKGQYSKQIMNKVSLEKSYFGTIISRDTGLTITKSDSLSKVTLNSDYLKWQVDKGAGLADVLYYDATANALKYKGILEITQDDGKAKTLINATETSIYGATGTGGALEKNFSVNSSGHIITKNIDIVGSINFTSGSITWGTNNPVPSYIGATHIDMSSLTTPYVIAGSLQGSNFVHYPPAPDSPLSYYGTAMKWDAYWGSNIYIKNSGVLTGLTVGSVVNVGSSAYGMNYAYRATILNFRLGDGTIVSYPTQICNLDIAYVGMVPVSSSAYISLANQTTLGEPFTLYNVPITNHTDLSGYASNKIGGIKYTAGRFTLFTENDTAMKIQSDGTLEIESDSIFMKQVSNNAIVFYWGSQVYWMAQAANLGDAAIFIRLV